MDEVWLVNWYCRCGKLVIMWNFVSGMVIIVCEIFNFCMVCRNGNFGNWFYMKVVDDGWWRLVIVMFEIDI